MHYALLLAEVKGEWGAQDLLLLMLRGDRRHRRVHPKLWTCHSTSMSSNIRSRRMRRRRIRNNLNFSRVISIRRGMSITRGIRLSLTRDIDLSSLLSSSMSSLLSSNSLSSILSSMLRLVWRMRTRAFQGGLTTCLFYRTSVNTWHSDRYIRWFYRVSHPLIVNPAPESDIVIPRPVYQDILFDQDWPDILPIHCKSLPACETEWSMRCRFQRCFQIHYSSAFWRASVPIIACLTICRFHGGGLGVIVHRSSNSVLFYDLFFGYL